MNPITKEMRCVLMHVGVKRRSGRYPWGSGKEPYQRSGDFLSRIKSLKEEGKTEKKIADLLGLTTDQLRIQKSLAKDERRNLLYDRVISLQTDGLNPTEIARKMGYKNESSVRALLKEGAAIRMKKAQDIADILREEVEKKGFIDVGKGVERELDASRELLKKSLYILELEGYPTHGLGVPTGPQKQTNIQVLCLPGTEHSEAFKARDEGKIQPVREHRPIEGEEAREHFTYPKSMDPDRVMVRYAEEGGVDKDGLIEIRRGVKDLSLGSSRYAQVRILVDDDRFMKGMAVYSDDLPDGVDVVFNTNKKIGVDKRDVFKEIKNDPDNPFGSLIKEGGQSWYEDENGEKQLSLINKRAEEGDWDKWTDTLPAQFLSKQNKTLIQNQIKLTLADKQDEFDEIMSLTNPTIKREMLEKFAEGCDSSAVHLEAAALPGQKYKAIMPVPTMKDNEVYAPTFEDGERIVLIRFPHGGTFEIPVLKVNNKQKDGKRLLENAEDAVGINKKVADQLSGADFDGDAVLAIPLDRGAKTVQITARDTLPGLKGFDAKEEYKQTPGMKYMRRQVGNKIVDNTQKEMGVISNLITDMTIKGATDDELVRAVKHSMVVIDAAKHKLDYKKSEEDNGIAALKKKYQGRIDEETGKYKEGASTLLSRASSEKQVLKRIGSPHINQKGKPWYNPDKPEGAVVYNEVNEEYKLYKKVKDPATGGDLIDQSSGKVVKVDTGKTARRTQKSTQMAEVDDARKLSSGTLQEEIYAGYANTLKEMAIQARKESVYTKKLKYDASANKTYAKEVAELNAALKIAQMNAPREREAQLISNHKTNVKQQANPDMTKDEIKKTKQQELTRARINVGAKKEKIKITDRQWDAIQAGAITDHALTQIIKNSDSDEIRKRAMPKVLKKLSQTKINRMKAMNDSGYTLAQIAEAFDVSPSTVSDYIKERKTV